jgi:hypothetical protein
MGANAKKKTAAPFRGDAHAFLKAIYQAHTLPLAMRLDAAKAAIWFEKPVLGPASPDANAALPSAR